MVHYGQHLSQPHQRRCLGIANFKLEVVFQSRCITAGVENIQFHPVALNRVYKDTVIK